MVRCIMKKGLLGVGIGAAAMFALFGTKALYYAQYGVDRVRDSARAAMPFEADVEAARRQVEALDPAIDNGIETLVKLEESIKGVQVELASLEGQMARSAQRIQALKSRLDGQDIHRVSQGAEKAVHRAKLGLTREIDGYQRARYIHEVKQSELESRQAQRQRLFDALTEMKARKAELLSKIQEIQAKHDAQELVGEFEHVRIDTGALAEAERAVAELDSRVSREVRSDELHAQFLDDGLPALDESLDPERDVLGEADAILGERGTSDRAGNEL